MTFEHEVDAHRVQVPRATGRVAWSRERLDAIPDDGRWHALKKCGRTTAYQAARQLNFALDIAPDLPFEFGAVEEHDGTSTLVARRRAHGPSAGQRQRGARPQALASP